MVLCVVIYIKILRSFVLVLWMQRQCPVVKTKSVSCFYPDGVKFRAFLSSGPIAFDLILGEMFSYVLRIQKTLING